MADTRRVVVTGLGVVCALDGDVETFWAKLLAGTSGARPVTRWDVHAYASEFTTRFACQVPDDWDVTRWIDRRYARHLDPFARYGCVAAQQALADAGLIGDDLILDSGRADPHRVGGVLASGIGGLPGIEATHSKIAEAGPKRISPFFIPEIMLNAFAGQVAIRHGLKGLNYATASACASATHAIGMAYRHVRWGDADIMVTGGSESTVTPLGLGGFCAPRALSTRNDDPKRASRPFDRDRDGFVLGEGAGVIILEELTHAKRRGAHIYAEVVGMGATDDANHITAPAPDGDGARRAMQLAIDESRLPLERFNHINAHGTSTELNDRTESLAIEAVFGEHAKRLCVSATKSMVGHCLGGSGGVELVALAKGIETQKAHLTLNHEHPGDGCRLDYVKGESRDWPITAALSNSFGFGGHNACVAVARYDD